MPKLKKKLGHLDLVSKQGDVLMLEDVDAWARVDGDAVTEVAFTGRISYKDWRAVDQHALFGLSADARGDVFGGRLDESKPVWLECGLAPELVALASSVLETADDLDKLTTLNTFTATESWRAWAVAQDTSTPGVRTGFRTKWNPR